MMNSSVFSLVIVLSCVGTQLAKGSVTGFIETFSGSGTGAGFDNPGWQAFGSVTEEAGFLNFQSVDETPNGILRRQIQGMGSFRTTLEFRELYLGETDDWQSGSNVFLSHILGGGVWRLLIVGGQ